MPPVSERAICIPTSAEAGDAVALRTPPAMPEHIVHIDWTRNRACQWTMKRGGSVVSKEAWQAAAQAGAYCEPDRVQREHWFESSKHHQTRNHPTGWFFVRVVFCLVFCGWFRIHGLSPRECISLGRGAKVPAQMKSHVLADMTLYYVSTGSR